MPSNVYLVVALIYGAVALFFWRRAYGSAPATREIAPQGGIHWSNWSILLAIVLHGWILLSTVFVEQGINLCLGNAISLIIWLMVLIFWLGSWVYPLVSLQMFVLPIAVVGVLFALLVPSDRVLSIASRPALMAHLVMSLLAYSLFTIAALHAILTAVLDRGLRHGNTPTALRDAPPLIALETLLLRIIQLGFVLLTLARQWISVFGTSVRQSDYLSAQCAQGYIWRSVVADLWRILDRPSLLRLARANSGDADLDRVRIIAPRLCRQ